MSVLPELDRIGALAQLAPTFVRIETLAKVDARGVELPIQAVTIGSTIKTRPTIGLFGGVHGLERIGTHVVLAFLESFIGRLSWDKDARRAAKKCRIVAIPMVNPGGIYLRSRSNPRGVDLMRNAPVEAEVKTPMLAGGHRYGAWLPWFRGWGPLETESQALVDFVRREMFPAECAIALDIHSGFGLVDRLWYPYAKNRQPIRDIHHALALSALLDRTLPHHVYRLEPQSASYTTHGDLWDYLYDLYPGEKGPSSGLFLPWTLEIGSWNWVRKSPVSLFRRDGLFNPNEPHRYSRAMRRHLLLFEFLLRAVRAHRRWQPEPIEVDDEEEEDDDEAAEKALDNAG